MKILLTGGFGYLGKRFIEKFSNSYDFVIYAKKDSAVKHGKYGFPDNVVVEEGSVEDEKIVHVIKNHKPEVVIHLAAITGLARCEENPSETFKINVFGTHNVVKSCIESGSRLIFASSFEVYGKTQKYESDEDDTLNPVNTYAITKMLGEEIVKLAGRNHDLNYTILRISNVYGPGYSRGINTMIKRSIKEKTISVNGVNRFRNFLYVDDAVQLINLVINDKRTTKDVFNIGSTDTLILKELAEKILHLLKLDVRIECRPELKIEANYRPNLKKLMSLGYAAKTPLDEGLEKTIKWQLEKDHGI